MALIVLVGSLLAGGCERDPLDIPCPEVGEGDLVITEIHGPQSGADGYGEWIEVFNATAPARTLDLTGLQLTLRKLDGSKDIGQLVRSEILLDPGQYGVFGKQITGSEPPHVNYGYGELTDASGTSAKIFDSAAIVVSSCGVLIDEAVYRNLPSRGSMVLSGAINPPSAEDNGDADNGYSEINWCTDEREDANSEENGIRGTPGEENPVCP